MKPITSASSQKEQKSNLASDLRTRGCAVCNHVINTARDFFAQWQYALSSDKEAQARFAAELGFCPVHAWQLHSMSSPWGESIGLAALTENISRLLAKTERGETAAFSVQKIPRTLEDCRVCGMVSEAESAYIERLGVFIADEKGRQIYERSHGPCLRHLSRLLSVTSEATHEFLLTAASRRFNEMTQEMQSYAAKREALRRDLMKTDEEDAYLRALVHLVGAKDYCAP